MAVPKFRTTAERVTVWFTTAGDGLAVSSAPRLRDRARSAGAVTSKNAVLLPGSKSSVTCSASATT